MEQIKGYDYESKLPTSPISLQDLELLKKTLLWSEQDELHLKQAAGILADQCDDILDLWYGYVGSLPHLLQYFSHQGQADPGYLAAVRVRFGKWIMDICSKPYDQQWLNYQYEIALRHHSSKKNKTDEVQAAPIIHFRYMVAFIYPITATIRPFLAKKGNSPEEVEAMFQAWFKAVTLSTLLWCYPYIREGEF